MFVIDLNSIFEIEGSIQKARIVSNLWHLGHQRSDSRELALIEMPLFLFKHSGPQGPSIPRTLSWIV